MDMTIDESRQNQLAPEIFDLHVVGQARHDLCGGPDLHDPACVDEQYAVLVILGRRAGSLPSRICEAVVDFCPIRFGHRHGSTSITGSSRSCSSQLARSPARSMIRNSCPSSKAMSGMCHVPR